MNNPTSILEQAQRRIGAAGKRGAIVRRVRGKVMWVGRAMAYVMGLSRTGSGIRLSKRTQENHDEIVTTIKRSVCVLVLITLFLAVGVGGRPGSDIGAAEVRVPPTANIAPTATLSPEPDADGRNKDVAPVILLARFKAH
ncbi:MAG: hypothetical protein M3Q62_03450 [Actinomycetota bacterium]|nr:hypothetical protein [Rubrobacteraceae bacterium]MDQ3182597.1 hypothetical protein [Actinomycetota bacterium]